MLSKEGEQVDSRSVEALYEESRQWHVNTGEKTIHVKRMPGQFRTLKWFTATVWLIFFMGPYLRWEGKQAILLDIPERQFHIFAITVHPQDIWLLAMVLLFFAILLAVVTAIAGRVFCGFFCFQTVWTDVFTWIEEKLEGAPAKRHKLDKAPWDSAKIRIKLTKHTLWLLIAMLTGVTFAAWFTDAHKLWHDYFTLQAPTVAWIVLGLFTAGTYILAGFMREQVCFWLCPYARIQGVMYDKDTLLPTYDHLRGEPRGKLKKSVQSGEQAAGDCIDCHMCVAVCPTGIDIRNGQQEGCITCALCIDACDAIMDKVMRPRGLIRYASLDELRGKPVVPLYKRPRVLVYASIMLLAAFGLIYGLSNLTAIELKVLHERQPLFVLLSDGLIQNKYEVKVLNKTDKALNVVITVEGPENMQVAGIEEPITVHAGQVSHSIVYVRIPPSSAGQDSIPVTFQASDVTNTALQAAYQSMFFGSQK